MSRRRASPGSRAQPDLPRLAVLSQICGDGKSPLRERSPTFYRFRPASPSPRRWRRSCCAQADRDPLKLAEMTVLLPNRRACRTLQEAFLRQAIQPDADRRRQPAAAPDADRRSRCRMTCRCWAARLFGEAAEIPPAIGELKRRMLLARLIMAAPQQRRRRRRHHPPGPGGAAGGGAGAAAGPGGDRAQGSVRAGRAGAGEPGAALAADDQLPRHPAPRLAGHPGGRRRDRSRRPAQPAARSAARACGKRRRRTTPIIAAGSTGSIPAAADLMHAGRAPAAAARSICRASTARRATRIGQAIAERSEPSAIWPGACC